MSCYDYHLFNGVDVGRDLHRITQRGSGRYKPLLEHVARRRGRRRSVVRVRDRRRGAPPPVLTPRQIERICEARAGWDEKTREWSGSVRNRLLWMLLAETGVRLGEARGLQHRDWHTGRGDTPFIEVVPRDHPHQVRAKSGYRRLYVSDELDRFYDEYVWRLREAGADLVSEDIDATCVFVNLNNAPRFAPWRPESVYDLVDRLRRELSGQVPPTWTPPLDAPQSRDGVVNPLASRSTASPPRPGTRTSPSSSTATSAHSKPSPRPRARASSVMKEILHTRGIGVGDWCSSVSG